MRTAVLEANYGATDLTPGNHRGGRCRGVLDLDERGGFTPVLLARGPGELELRVNGSPAGLRAPHVHEGLQLLVFSQAACAQLRPGRNVIEVTGRHLDPRQPVTLELLRGPDLSPQSSKVL